MQLRIGNVVVRLSRACRVKVEVKSRKSEGLIGCQLMREESVKNLGALGQGLEVAPGDLSLRRKTS